MPFNLFLMSSALHTLPVGHLYFIRILRIYLMHTVHKISVLSYPCIFERKKENKYSIHLSSFSSHTISHGNIFYYFLLSVAYCFCYYGSSACSGRISFSEFAYFSVGFASVTIIASPMSANLTVLISPNFS